MVDAFQNNVNEYQKRQNEMEEQIAATKAKSHELQQIMTEDNEKITDAQSKIGDIDQKKENL